MKGGRSDLGQIRIPGLVCSSLMTDPKPDYSWIPKIERLDPSAKGTIGNAVISRTL